MKAAHLVLILVVLSTLGCQTSQPIRHVEPSGFLGDYTLLKPGPDGGPALLYRNPQVDFRAFEKYMIDPVTIWYTDDDSLRDVPQEDLQNLARLLQVKLIEALRAEGFTRVQEPEPGTMRIRAALTEAQQSHIVLDVLTTVIPKARIISSAKQLALGTHSWVGKAGIEAELLDAQSGETARSHGRSTGRRQNPGRIPEFLGRRRTSDSVLGRSVWIPNVFGPRRDNIVCSRNKDKVSGKRSD